MLRAARRTTIYASQADKAIEFADLVFASRKRLGMLGPRDFTPRARRALAHLPNLQFIDCKVTKFSNGHDYVFAHPAALSDLILVLRDRKPPGAENGRPLTQVRRRSVGTVRRLPCQGRQGRRLTSARPLSSKMCGTP